MHKRLLTIALIFSATAVAPPAGAEGRAERALARIHAIWKKQPAVKSKAIARPSAADLVPNTIEESHVEPTGTAHLGNPPKKHNRPAHGKTKSAPPAGASTSPRAARTGATQEGKPHQYTTGHSLEPTVLFLHGLGQATKNDVATRLVDGLKTAEAKLNFISVPWESHLDALKKAISDAKPDSLILAGHSAGAGKVVELMRELPGAFRKAVKASVLINPTELPEGSAPVPTLLIRGQNDHKSPARDVAEAVSGRLESKNVALWVAENGDHSLRHRENLAINKDWAATTDDTKFLNWTVGDLIKRFVDAPGMTRFKLKELITKGDGAARSKYGGSVAPSKPSRTPGTHIDLEDLWAGIDDLPSPSRTGFGGGTGHKAPKNTLHEGYVPPHLRGDYSGHRSHTPSQPKTPKVTSFPPETRAQMEWTLRLFHGKVVKEDATGWTNDDKRRSQYRALTRAIGKKSGNWLTEPPGSFTPKLVKRAESGKRSKVYRSDQPSKADLIKFATEDGQDPSRVAIINLRYENGLDKHNASTAAAESALKKMAMFHIPIVDHAAATVAQMAEVLRIVQDPRFDKVLIHCKAGHARTGQSVALIRVLLDGWKVKDAVDEARRLGMGREVQHAFVEHFVELWKEGKIDIERGAIKGDDGLPGLKAPSTSRKKKKKKKSRRR